MPSEKKEGRRPPLLSALSTTKINDQTRTPSSVGSSSSPSQRILLAVEDDRATIKLITRMAEKKGWTLVLATSYTTAVEAYEKYADAPYFAITSDHNLTGSPSTAPKKGLDFATYVRVTKQNQHVPIVMHSATTEPGFDQACAELNVESWRKGTVSYSAILDYLLSNLSADAS